MGEYELVVNYEKCTGCRLCEIGCSMYHGAGANPEKARVRVIKMEGEADVVSIPVKCMRCEDAPCILVCPVGAISTDPETGARQVDKNKCIGCSACVFACPFGAAILDRQAGHSLICDLCDGDPTCAKLCPWNAIQWVRSDEVSTKLKRIRASKLLEYLRAPSESTTAKA